MIEYIEAAVNVNDVKSGPALRQVQPPEGPHQDSHRGEALRLQLARLWMEVQPVRRADQTLQETHRQQTFQVSSLSQGFLQVRSYGA